MSDCWVVDGAEKISTPFYRLRPFILVGPQTDQMQDRHWM